MNDKPLKALSKTKRGKGRPTIYTEKLAKEICQGISKGKSVRSLTKKKNMPSAATIFLWLIDKEKRDFLEQYTQARNVQAETLFEELLEIADESKEAIVGDDKSDNARVQARKLMVDTRKWYLSKVLPKKFGDKLDLTSLGKELPTPIFGNVSMDDSDKSDSETKE